MNEKTLAITVTAWPLVTGVCPMHFDSLQYMSV